LKIQPKRVNEKSKLANDNLLWDFYLEHSQMKTLSDGCSVIFGLLILYAWFQFHWLSALGFVGLFLLWAFMPLFFAIFKTSSNLHAKKIIKSKPRKKLKSDFSTVPSFSQYFPSVEIMSADQLAYYKH